MILPTPLESLFLALKAVKRGAEAGTLRNTGICLNVSVHVVATHRALAERPDDDPELADHHRAVMGHLDLMFEALGLDPCFPVPSPDPNFSAGDIFLWHDIPRWTGEYGAARRALLDQLLELCGKLLGAE